MADSITQRLGFEAGNAISTINDMASALGKLNTKIRAFNKASNEGSGGDKIAASLDKTGDAAKRAGTKIDQATQKFSKFGKEGKSSVQKVSVAWIGLAKALVARTAVQAITKLTGAIADSAEAAADFEIAMARISNIARGPGSSIAELTKSLSELAVELGRPQAEVASAAFEALQNDLGTTAETMDLLAGAAHNLALVTGGTLTQSVNSLSSVLKAYNLPVTEAAKVSDQFFAAIDKGRITLKELENSLGKITPLAAKLDIEFGEVAGAMAAITQSGTSASVANTQLRSIMQKLIRPTEELQLAFNKLGTDTFNQLIEKSGGLRQALQAIAGALDNDDKAIAKAFGRLRGQLGVFNLLSNEGKIFAETMDAVAASSGKAAAGAATVDGTNARKAEKAWAKFDETLRQVGESVLVVKTEFISAFNRIIPDGETVIKVMKAIAIGVGLVTAAFLTMKIAAIAALAAAGSTPIGAVFVVAATAIAAAAYAIDAFYETYAEKVAAIEKRSLEAKENILENSKKAAEQANKDIEDLLAKRTKIEQDYIDGMEKAFDRETEALQQSSKVVSDSLQASVQDFVSGMNSAIDSMKSKLKSVEKDLAKARESSRSAKQELEDFKFDKALKGKTQFQQLTDKMNQAKDTARGLDKSMEEALSNPEAINVAEADIERLKKQAQSLLDLADKEDNAYKKRQLEKTGEDLMEKALKAAVQLEENKVKALEAQAQVTESMLNTQKAITVELGEQVKKAAELMDIYDKAGKLKSPEQQTEDKAKYDEINKNVTEIMESLNTGLFETFGNRDVVDKLVSNLADSFNQAAFDFANIREAIDEKINQKEFKVFADVVLNFESSGNAEIDKQIKDKIQDAGGNPVSQSEAGREGRVDALKAQEALEQAHFDAQERRSVAENDLLEAGNLALENKGSFVSTLYDAITAGSNSASEIWKSLLEIQEQVLDPAATTEALTALDPAIDALKEKLKTATDGEEIPEKFAEQVSLALEAAETIIKEKQLEIQIKPQFDKEVIATLKRQLDEATGAGEDGALRTATAVGTITTAMGVTIAKTNQATQAAQRLEAALLAAARAAASIAPSGGAHYHGGKVAYRATGGPTRGLDSQLTATSPGEFIMNSRSSARFFSELQAMNAGQSPQYRDKGGPVTNIGDINVSVSSESDSPQLGRQIARDLERELRFKTSTL